MEASALEVVASVLSLDIFAEPVAVEHPSIQPLLDSSKVSDHFAIVPTTQMTKANFSALPMEQQQVLTLIAGKLLCAVSAPHIYESTKVTMICENTEFTVTGKTIIDNGFKEIERIVEKKSGGCKADETTEKKGIGTPATRASVIEGLVKDGYISRAENILTATQTGLNLVSVVPEEIRSAKLTTDWEIKLQAIEQGNYSADTFMEELESLITQQVQKYSGMKDSADTSLFEAEKEVLGTCPRCGGYILYGAKYKNYYCDKRNCGFALWENNRLFSSMGKKITKGIIADFLTKGESYVEGFVSKKTEKPFNAMVVVKDTGQYINFDLKFQK